MIVWLKLATAGGSPFSSPILEVGLVLTDDKLNEQTTLALPVKPARKYRGWNDRMAPSVARRHRASGLSWSVKTGMSVTEVDSACADIVRKAGGGVRLGAVDPKLTREFLRAQMPITAHRFTDAEVSIVGLRAEAHKPAPAAPRKPRRAIVAARAMVDEAKVLMASLGTFDPARVPVVEPEQMESII